MLPQGRVLVRVPRRAAHEWVMAPVRRGPPWLDVGFVGSCAVMNVRAPPSPPLPHVKALLRGVGLMASSSVQRANTCTIPPSGVGVALGVLL